MPSLCLRGLCGGRIVTRAAPNRRPRPQTKSWGEKNAQNMPTEQVKKIHSCGRQFGTDPQFVAANWKTSASPGFGNKSPRGFHKHGSNLEPRRNPDYVFDTPNPADPRFKTHIPSSAVSASTSLTRADRGGC